MTTPAAPPRATALPDRRPAGHSRPTPKPHAGTFANRLLAQRPATRQDVPRGAPNGSDAPLPSPLTTTGPRARATQHAPTSAHDESALLPGPRDAKDRDHEPATGAAVGMPDGAPFRPLPSCVFAPLSQARVAPPVTPPDELSRLATELLRSMHVGGTRARGQVRLVLDTAEGEPLEVTLDESPHGVVATLHGEHDAGTERLARAIARELARREVSVERVP